MKVVVAVLGFRPESAYGFCGRKTTFNQPKATVDYAIGLEKLSANERFFHDAQTTVIFVTDNSNYIRRLFYNGPCCLRQHK